MSDEPLVVVITGASGGIGAALAGELGAGGRRLVLAARRGDALRRVAHDAEARGAPDALVVETDVTRRRDVERLRDAALAKFGRFDVWVNNAGRGITRPVLELTDDDVDDIIAINVKSALYGMQAAVPHFVQRGEGHLINVSTFLSRVPIASVRSIYSAAKAALNSLTANLRMDLRTRAPGVHVSLVLPGLVATDFARNAQGGERSAVGDTASAGRTSREQRAESREQRAESRGQRAESREQRAGGPPAGSVPIAHRAPPAAMQVQSAEEVAALIARLIEHPVPELYTNPASPEVVRRYYADVAAFEAALP
jgi:short-subunit dehydrogenase